MNASPEKFDMLSPEGTGSAQAEALACAANGLPVFPLHGVTDGKCDCGHEHLEKDAGNHPCFGRSCVSATISTHQIRDWFDQRPNCNYAIAAGQEIGKSGTKLAIVAVGHNAAEINAVLTTLKEADVPHTVLGQVIAGEGSHYLYLSVGLDESFSSIKFENRAIKLVAYAPGPGSLHSNGEKTVWLTNSLAALSPTSATSIIETPQTQFRDGENNNEEPTAYAKGEHTQPTPSVTQPFQCLNSASISSAASDAILRIQKTRAAALAYTECGFKLCRIAKGSKKPTDTAWQDNPIDPQKAGDHGLGIIHKLSGTCAIDFDDMEGARAWFANEGMDIDEYLDGDDAVQIKSGRNNRAKLLFRVPPGINLLNTHKIKNSDGSMMIEFRCTGEGGKGIQDVLPPSIHPDTGNAYEWGGAGDYQHLPLLPTPLLDLWLRLNGSTNLSKAHVECKEVEAADADMPIVSEGGRNDALFKLGGDLAGLGLSPAGIEAALLQENEKRCIPPLGRSEVIKIAASASTSSRGAKYAASSELLEQERQELLKHAAMVLDAGIDTAAANMGDYHELPLVMKAIAEWCQTNGRTVQPAFALCTALAACSSVLSRDFTGAAGAHTNLYCVAVGPTGCGKENAIETVVQVVTAYQQTRLAGVPASDTGVLTAMKRHPASVFVIDEIGEVLQSVLDSKAASYVARIGTVFMELYTKGGKPYRGKEYANQSFENGKPRVDIFSPCPSIFGATTATTLYGAMTSDVVSSGFLPRMLVFRASDAIPMPNLDYAETPLPGAVHDWLAAIRARVEQHVAAVSEHAVLVGTASEGYIPVKIPYSREALELFREAQVEIVNRRNATTDTLDSNMMSRVVENAGRVALALALAEDPWATEVSAACFKHAMDIVEKSTAAFIADIRANLFDSRHAKLEAAVMTRIHEHFVATKGKPISDGVLVDHCRPYKAAPAHERKAVIESLVRQGKISISPGRKKGTVLYTPSFEM